MAPLILALPSLTHTRALGRLLGKSARAADIITLAGSLGAGKTALTQAIGDGLEVPDSKYISSPTFGLLHEYQGRLPLYHLDLYRLRDEREIEDGGLLENLHGPGLTVIEWPERMGVLMPEIRLHVELTLLGETARQAMLTPYGEDWRKKMEKLRELWQAA